jgi:subtilisin family serine protease
LGNGCFGEGCLVSFGTDLVGDAYTGSNKPNPDNDPMDCGGHGTHVAGIIAAQENSFGFTGAAPDVNLGAYRVFGCAGFTGEDILIAAFNQAYQDGADIISSSIGGPSGWSSGPWAVSGSRIVDKGVPVVISAGNEGATGIFYASSGSSGKNVAAIASFDNTHSPSIFTLFNYTVDGGDKIEFGMVPATPDNWAGVTLPVWALNYDTTVADDGCQAFPADTPDLSDKIVLIRRGGCNFVVKAANAVAKGAKYVIIYNNVRPGAGSIDFNNPEPSGVEAGGMVEAVTGEEWISQLKDGKEVTLYMADPETQPKSIRVGENLATGGALSAYTTWGPTWEMDVKPQYGAPGGNILSTYPVAKGSYAVLSGTSMSCPLTSAVTALVGEVRGSLDPIAIMNLLSANANPQLFNTGGKFIPYLAPVVQQGAGLIQAYDAAHATTLLEPSSFSFNDTAHFTKQSTFKLSNTGKKEVTYEISHNPALTFYSLGENSPYVQPFVNEAVDVYATLEFSKSTVTLGAGSSDSIDVMPTPPQGLNPDRLGVWTGYVVINGTDGTSLSLPYQGLTGSLHDHKVLQEEDTWIAVNGDENYTPVPANTTFTIPPPGQATGDDKLPVFAIFLALGSRKVVAHLQPMTTCPPKNTFQVSGYKSIGSPAGFPALWSSRGLGAFVWDGQLADGNYAAPGKYRLVVWALRIFGDENNEEDWDLSISPGFKIKYD